MQTHHKTKYILQSLFLCVFLLQPLFGFDDPDKPKPIPNNRQEMLSALEKLKNRTPRIPAPPDESSNLNGQQTGDGPPTPGSLGVVNNGLMRKYYLPSELQTNRSSRIPDPAMKLDREISTELFWIVSRVNNCHYCLGHQESKLLSAGVEESTLLSLDTNWDAFPDDTQAAFAFARKLTSAPHTVKDDDIRSLKQHFSDDRILEIIFLVARYNSTNRWTDSLGIPQESHREYTSNLSSEILRKPSVVAVETFPNRECYTDFQQWSSEFKKAATRKPRLQFASDSEAAPHKRLLLHFPVEGSAWLDQLEKAVETGELPKSLKPKIAYVAARLDHAWYMQKLSSDQLAEAGLTEQQIFDLATGTGENEAESVALGFAMKLTEMPNQMTDDDINELLKHYTARQTAEIVYHVGLAAFMNRLTESIGLGWQP